MEFTEHFHRVACLGQKNTQSFAVGFIVGAQLGGMLD